MSPAEAAKLLDLPVDATPEQIETRFNELRAKLEDRIAKAPTPGLKAKYRESLDDITAAFESLTLAADASALPVLQRQRTEDGGQKTGPKPAGSATSPSVPSPSSLPRSPAPGAKAGGGKEFAIVALIALAVLGAGGWWVMKTRTENETKARLTAQLATELAEKNAQQKAEAEQAARTAAQRAEEEKARLAAAEKAEQTRREQLGLQLRTRISELNITLEAALKSESLAERELSDLKTEERSLQREAKAGPTPDLRAAQAAVQAQETYLRWLQDNLATSRARVLRAQFEQLLEAKAYDEASAILDEYATSVKQLQADIAAQRARVRQNGSLLVTSEPAGVDYIVQDRYGRERSGRTPASLQDLPIGEALVTFARPGWPPREVRVSLSASTATEAKADLAGGALQLASTPFAVEFILEGPNETQRGRTPANYPELPVGDYKVTYQRAGWPSQSTVVPIVRDAAAAHEARFEAAGKIKVTSAPAGAEVWRDSTQLGVTPLVLPDAAPGKQVFTLRLARFDAAQVSGDLPAGGQLDLEAKLTKTVLTKQQGFSQFWQAAAGTWSGTSGRSIMRVRIVAGSDVIQVRIEGQDAIYSYQMLDYDAEHEGVTTKMTNFITRARPINLLRIKDGVLHWTLQDLSNPFTFQRISDSEF